jgi:two-component system CheB/CheR fusion protein
MRTHNESALAVAEPLDSRANILLVDDEPANLLALEAVLEDLGHNLVKAHSGEEALELLLDRDFAVVLLDVRMQGLDGFDTAQVIRRGDRSRHTPIIFLTAHDDNRLDVAQAYALGAVDYLVKPLVPVILRAKVAGFVELFQKTEQIRRQAEQLRRMERREFDRKLQEENARLLVSEERFARFMHHLPGLAWIKDSLGRYVFANDAARKAFRTARAADLQGKTDEEVFSPEVAARFRADDRLVLAGGTGVQVIETLEHPDGPLHYAVVKFPIPGPDGSRPLVGGIAIDITERQRAREVLEESEQRFRQLAENINEVFWMVDPRHSQMLYISPAYEQVWGRSCRSLYEQPNSFLDAVHSDDRARVTAGMERQGRGEPMDVEYRITRPDGTVRWVRDRSFPVKDAAGVLYRIAGIAEDVTEQKRLEAELRQRADQLIEADRRKDEFLAMLAHELRNPLAPIRNSAKVLRLLDQADPNIRRAGDMIERQVEHLARLVEDLLDVSRITRGKIRLHKEPIELAPTLARAVETSRPLIDARQHELTVTLPAEPVTIDGDATRLAQVISNLLHNAAKYTEEGGHIWLTADRSPGEAVVRVRDNGLGIPAELLPHVFDLFTQGDRSLARSEGGLGIGLTLVKNLVELHDGSVEARSEGPGRGSEFVVRLPTLERRTDRCDGEAADSRPRPTPRRVLVVDDNEDAAESLAILLRIEGHEVRTAHDGLAALDVARAFQPEVILLDIGLPRVSGYEVARRFRAEEGVTKALLIAVSGYGQAEDRRQSREAGFDAHLTKPADPAVLYALVAAGAGSS